MGNFNLWSLLTNWKSENRRYEGNASNNGMSVLKQFCKSTPGGKVNILLREGEMTVQFTWDANAPAQNSVYQLYSLSGESDDITQYTCVEEEQKTMEEVMQEKTTQEEGESKLPSAEVIEHQLNMEDLREERKMKRCAQQQIDTMRQIEEYVSSHYDIRYNLLTQQTEVAEIKDDIAQDKKDYTYIPLSKRMLNTIYSDVKRQGVYRSDREVEQYINSTSAREYHPFTEYFEALPEWDGVDRVTALAKRVSADALWVSSFHRWMLATTAQWMGVNNSEYANSVAPLLISKQQGWGKSTFCRMLMPESLRRYYTDSYDINAQSSAEAKLTTFGLINLDEFDRLSDRKMASLKNLMQMNSLNIRKAYKSCSEPLPRIASFIGTTNSVDLLSDPSGSRRFICVELLHEIDCSPIEYEQLYAQLKRELLDGERYWFSKTEEAAIQKNNAKFYRTNTVEELFRKCFRETQTNEPYSRYMSAHEVYEYLCFTHKKAMRGITPEKFAKQLPTLATKVHKEHGNYYRLVKLN